MQTVYELELIDGSKEERLPGFTPDFPYIATRAELDRYAEPTVPWHWHRTAELFFMESGCLEYTTPHGTWVFPAGSGGFLNCNVLHSTRIIPSEDSTVQLLHLFEPTFLAGTPESPIYRKYIQPLTASSAELIPLYPEDAFQKELLAEIRAAFRLSETQWGYEFSLRHSLCQIWLKLGSLAECLPRTDSGDSKIKTMLVYIQDHLSEPISVEDLAASVYVSKRVCFRLFQTYLHTTPLEYIRSLRLQKARHLLLSTEHALTDIAHSCGLGSSSYFGKLFRERFGCTPSEFRRNRHDRDSF